MDVGAFEDVDGMRDRVDEDKVTLETKYCGESDEGQRGGNEVEVEVGVILVVVGTFVVTPDEQVLDVEVEAEVRRNALNWVVQSSVVELGRPGPERRDRVGAERVEDGTRESKRRGGGVSLAPEEEMVT